MAVIVALPKDTDDVWRISSDTVPHITLLYLGEDLQDEDRIREFLQHVASTSLTEFMLPVDRRGTLGEEEADVLFLGDPNSGSAKRVAEVRSYLLTNPEINAAYHSIEQYPVWIPHLTLGYPKTPAKKLPGYGLPYAVQFDRIALWTDNTEGVAYQLKRSDANLFQMDKEIRGGHFAHYGVKGQKWGVVRSKLQKIRESKAAKYVAPSEDHVRAHSVKVRAKVAGVHTLTNKDLNTVIKRMDLEVKFKDLKTVQHQQSLVGKGVKAVGGILKDIVVRGGASWISRPGTAQRSTRTPNKSAPQHGNVVIRSVGAAPARTVIDGTFREN